MMLSGIPCFAASSETDTTYTMSVKDFDHVIYLARKGRMLDSVVNASLTALEALRASITSKDKVISLQGEQLANYRLLVETLKATISNDRELAILEKAKLKAQKKKWIKVAGAEAVALVVILVLLL